MGKYFYLEESPIYKNKNLIRAYIDKLPFPNGTNGSYNVLEARVMNLSYAEYLRYARDRLGAELIGKNHKYVIPYFDLNETTQMFVKLLNKRMDYIMNEQEYPFNYKEEDGKVSRIPFNNSNESYN